LFKSLLKPELRNKPLVVYFHENQLSYPRKDADEDVVQQRDHHYSFINYSSALAADIVLFNSYYHKDSFLGLLPDFLRMFPDNKNIGTIDAIAAKSEVLHLGIDLKRLDKLKPEKIEKFPRALLLWNHRWEFDKNPDAFFKTLFEISERGIEFKLAVLGEQFATLPAIFTEAKERLTQHIVHWGYAEREADYVSWLWRADILPVTARQDFFGVSVVEAAYCNTIPFLPKRLAYAEHFPKIVHNTLFYNESEFTDKLQKRIMDVKLIRVQNSRQWVEQYDWTNSISRYEALFEKAVANQ
jgi:glycosyltransferase involved in cell wall biosynthesis